MAARADRAGCAIVATELGISADAIVFVDTKAGNVADAEPIGMTGPVLRGATGLRAFLLGPAANHEGDDA